MLSRFSIHVEIAAPSEENMKDILIDIISERNLPGLLQDSRETFLTRARAELRVHTVWPRKSADKVTWPHKRQNWPERKL